MNASVHCRVVMFSFLLGVCLVRPVAAQGVSTFDSGYDGWSPVSFDNSRGWTWQAQGGNGGGFVQIANEGGLSAPFFNFISGAPGFLGDWSSLAGVGAFRYDFKTDDPSPIRNAYVIVESATGGRMIYDQSYLPTAGGLGWQTISAVLTPGHWKIQQGSWESILSNVSSVEIYPLYQDSGGSYQGRLMGIDNIMLVPEPGTWALLGVGLTMLIVHKCVRNSNR